MKKKTFGLLCITISMMWLAGCGDINVYQKENENEESKTKIDNIFKKDDEENKNNVEKVEDKELQKALLENELIEIGRYFYEDYYYRNIQNTQNDPKSFVAKYKDIGIKVDISNLANLPKYKEQIDEDFKNCDSKETKVIIHPQEPFSVTDYDITVNLSCSFDHNIAE